MKKILGPKNKNAGDAERPLKSPLAWISCSILAILTATPFIAMILWSSRTQALRSVVMLVATSILLSTMLAVCAGTWRRFFLLIFPFWALAGVYATYAILFGNVPGHAVALLLAGASLEEFLGLFNVWQQKWIALPVAGILALYLVLTMRLPVWPILSRSVSAVVRVLLVMTVPMTIYAAQNFTELKTGIALNPVVGSLMFFASQMSHAHNELQGKLVVKSPFYAHRIGTAEEVHILIVGESARRASWSAYGYSRETTPFISQLMRDKEVIVLRNAMSDANLTIIAVPIMLTGLTPQEFARGRRPAGTLLDLAREAGYETAWLVNQDVEISTSMGIVADHLEYPPDFHESMFSRSDLDEVLLPAYCRELGRTGHARFIGMHVMGSHWEYYRRYTQAFQRFGSAERISTLSSATTDRSMVADLADAYDNSVLYTDWFIKQIIDPARNLQVPVTVTFVPDHGEASPYLDGGAVGHGAAKYISAEFEIPAVIWMNAAYRKAHPEKVQALETNTSQEIRTHDIFFTLADLMGITWPGANATRSFASERFAPDTTKQHLARGLLVARP
jgi:glucan phosphoethanolaminetransferase (alkaline phosphatase superfamily)